jgi:HEAT repeat protein
MVRMVMGVLMSVLMMIGVGKAAYDRYFRDRFKAAPENNPPDTTPIDNPLKHSDWRVRAEAVSQLEPTPEHIETLLVLLHDADYDVRLASRNALVNIGTAAVQPLLTVLEQGKLDARQIAAEALGQIADESAVAGLIAALDDESKWVRLAAVEALGQFNAPSARDALAQTVDVDEDAQVRTAAKEALV